MAKKVTPPKPLKEAIMDEYFKIKNSMKDDIALRTDSEIMALARKRVKEQNPKAIKKATRKLNKGAQDFRKGGMVLSTVDNLKNK